MSLHTNTHTGLDTAGFHTLALAHAYRADLGIHHPAELCRPLSLSLVLAPPAHTTHISHRLSSAYTHAHQITLYAAYSLSSLPAMTSRWISDVPS